MSEKKMSEIEQEIISIMDKFDMNSEKANDQKNFELLKSIQGELMKRVVTDDVIGEELNPFLRNFLEEFDNTYAGGLPEAIITALKNGQRVHLAQDWKKTGTPKS